MCKIRKISQFQYNFQFKSSEENFRLIYQKFSESNLGKIYHAIPWLELVEVFKLKKTSRKGPDNIFSPQGKLGLMFLKHYVGCSDQKMIEQLNANVHYQIFCDILLSPEDSIKNYKIVSQIRCELAEHLDINEVQKVLAKKWSSYMSELSNATTDATCYESEVRYPTNQKLLWECVEWNYNQMKVICKHLKIKLPRTKYLKWKNKYFIYSRKRRKPAKDKRVLTRGLLNLLSKLNNELDIIQQNYDFDISEKYLKRREIIYKVYHQQFQLFTTGEKPKDRIISIAKSYLRPIVRGKEIKKVEFGAKVNKIQIDGISFIEHLSFDAFNEGTRFQSSVRLSQELTHTRLRIMGADAIYATNANRKFATEKNISTDFCRKGRAGKHESQRLQLAKLITKERASRLEGSFGKEKEHYHLKKIKAKTLKTEILWIFFGIHTANALEIGRRMTMTKQLKTA
jgi:hypothetical protein